MSKLVVCGVLPLQKGKSKPENDKILRSAKSRKGQAFVRLANWIEARSNQKNILSKQTQKRPSLYARAKEGKSMTHPQRARTPSQTSIDSMTGGSDVEGRPIEPGSPKRHKGEEQRSLRRSFRMESFKRCVQLLGVDVGRGDQDCCMPLEISLQERKGSKKVTTHPFFPPCVCFCFQNLPFCALAHEISPPNIPAQVGWNPRCRGRRAAGKPRRGF